MLHRVLASLALLAVAGCKYDVCFDPKAVPSGAVSTSKSPIIGGSVDTTNKSTVALLITRPDQKHALCSGSVIATQGTTGYVLTAAHCVTGTVDKVVEATNWEDCTPAGDASKCGATYTPIKWMAHPAYDANLLANDFGLVIFEGATPATTVTPAVDGADAIVAGEVVEISGYGRTYAGPNDPSLFQSNRNHVTLPIDTVSTNWFRFDASTGKTACFGDSGGPTFALVNGHRRVVGVASAADANCAQVAIYGRVSAVYDDFIKPIIQPALAGDCKSCLQSRLGSSGTCDAERAQCQSSAECDAISTCMQACPVPDQVCYVGCASPHVAGTAAFNVLASCLACASCSAECGVPACSGSGSSSSSSSGGGSSPGTGGAGGAGGSGAGGSGSGGSGSGGSGSAGGAGAGGANGAGGGWSDGGWNGGYRGGLGGAGGAGGTASSGTSSGSSQVCVPLSIKCSLSNAADASDEGASSVVAMGAVALAVLRKRRIARR